MSGFKKSNRRNDKYLFASIIGGMFHIPSLETNPEAVKRKKKTGAEVFEIVVDELTDVYLHDVSEQDSEFGKQLSITTKSQIEKSDEQNFYCIQCSLGSGYAVSFLSRVKNVDLDKPIDIKIFEIPFDGTDGKEYKNKVLGIYQNGKMLEKVWTKEENPVPKAKPILDSKKKPVIKNGFAQFDDNDKIDFLTDFVNNNVQPDIRAFTLASNSNESRSVAEVDQEVTNDDLPF